MCDLSNKKVRLLRDPPKMDKGKNEIADKILHFTLDIINLLTGEGYTVVKKKSGDTVAPSKTGTPFKELSLIHEEILQLAHRITELLTGENVLLLRAPPRKNKDRNELTNRILHFTLEIIRLLTGEDSTIVKKTLGDNVASSSRIDESEGLSPIMEFPPLSQTHEQQILEFTNRITELLTGKEWEPLQGHKDMYREAVMEDEPPLISEDGRIHKNPLKKRLHPRYSQACPMEKPSIPEYYQEGDLTIRVQDESEEESLRDDDPNMSEVEEEIPAMIMPDGRIHRNPPKKRLHSRYSQECPEENPSGTDYYQGGDLNIIRVEDDSEEESLRDDDPSMSEEEENPADLMPDNSSKNYEEDEDNVPHSSGENRHNFNVHLGFDSTDLSYDFPMFEEGSGPTPNMTIRIDEKGMKVFQCDICEKLFKRTSSLLAHQRVHSGEKPFSCSDCGKRFMQKSHLVLHKKIHTGEKLYSCLECGKSFTQKSNLVKHERIHTGEKPFSCSQCEKSFPYKSLLVNHERVHTGEKPYSCLECGKCFTRKKNLAHHEKCHREDKPYSCAECGKTFSLKAYLELHEKTHTGDKPYSCAECGKSFPFKSNLLLHEISHTGAKPYSCSECGKCFLRKTHLIDHERIHTGERPHACPDCGKSFINKGKLKRHYRRHTGEKPHTCLECGKSFTDKETLNVHARRHRGEKPYSCSECGKAFTDRGNLIVHERRHEEKPYSCSDCGRCYADMASLVIHEKSHTGAKPYPCSVCGKYFITRDKLLSHECIRKEDVK